MGMGGRVTNLGIGVVRTVLFLIAYMDTVNIDINVHNFYIIFIVILIINFIYCVSVLVVIIMINLTKDIP